MFGTFSQDFNPPWPPLGKGGKQEETNLASPLTKGGLRGVPPTLTDAEYEAKLMELLEGVNPGWGRGDVAEFLLAKRIKNGDLAAWLRRFGDRLLAGGHGDAAATDAVVSLQKLARRLELLGRVAIGELGECAGNVGREILVEFSSSSVEGDEVGDREAEEWKKRGNEQYMKGNFEWAIAFWDKAIEIKPDYHVAWYNRGVALGNLGRFEEAITSYDKALEFKPDLHEAGKNRGIALLYNLGRFEDAITSYDKALEIKPDDHEAWNDRGIALRNLGRFEEAIADFDKALEIKPDNYVARHYRGISLYMLGRFEEAIVSYDKALEIQPDYYVARHYRGISLYMLGRFEEAIVSYDKVLKFKPDDEVAWYNRGLALGNLNRFEDAIASYDKAL